MGNQGKAAAIQVEASIKSRYAQQSVKTGFAFGISKKHEQQNQQGQQEQEVKIVSNVEVKTPSAPLYEVKLTSEAKMPRVANRWNKERLLEEALRLVFNGKIEYGYEQSSNKQTVQIESNIFKSHQQKQAVRQSPEYEQCQQEEQQGTALSPVCEKLRHQAASVDRIEATLRFPQSVVQHSWFAKLGEAAKAYFLVQLNEQPSSEAPTDLQTLKLIANVSRVGQEAQLQSLYNGRQYQVNKHLQFHKFFRILIFNF